MEVPDGTFLPVLMKWQDRSTCKKDLEIEQRAWGESEDTAWTACLVYDPSSKAMKPNIAEINRARDMLRSRAGSRWHRGHERRQSRQQQEDEV